MAEQNFLQGGNGFPVQYAINFYQDGFLIEKTFSDINHTIHLTVVLSSDSAIHMPLTEK
jgi:hypothetical protein